MKTRIFILSLLMTLCSIFSACENQAVDITVTADITINTASVLAPFIAYDSSDLDMYPDSKVRLTCLLYDAAGALINRQDIALSDFSSSANIQEKIGSQTYTLVVVASCVSGGSLLKPEYEAYSLTGVNNLNTLNIEQIKSDISKVFDSCWQVLGFGIQENLTQSEYEPFMTLKPATALVYMNFRSIHASSNIDLYAIGWTSNNLMTFTQQNAGFSCNVDGIYDECDIEPDRSTSENLYSLFSVFPGECSVVGASFVGNTVIDWLKKSVTIQAGHQYVFQYNCSTSTLTAQEGKL